MIDLPDVMRLASSAARHAASRQVVISENLAQANTPGYKTRDLAPFAETYHAPGTLRATRATHINRSDSAGAAQIRPDRDAPAHAPNGNTVSLEREMMRSALNTQDHELALSVYRSARTVLRTALGR